MRSDSEPGALLGLRYDTPPIAARECDGECTTGTPRNSADGLRAIHARVAALSLGSRKRKRKRGPIAIALPMPG
jgi:hypothetical protein